MARVLYTGFEGPWTHQGSPMDPVTYYDDTGSSVLLAGANIDNYFSSVYNIAFSDVFRYHYNGSVGANLSKTRSSGHNGKLVYSATEARTLTDGLGTALINDTSGEDSIGLSILNNVVSAGFGVSYFTRGVYAFADRVVSFVYGDTRYFCTADTTVHITSGAANSVFSSTKVAEIELIDNIQINTWYFVQAGVDGAGIITFRFNGTEIQFQTPSVSAVTSDLEIMSIPKGRYSNGFCAIDDIALNNRAELVEDDPDTDIPDPIKFFSASKNAVTDTSFTGFSPSGPGAGTVANAGDALLDYDSNTKASSQYVGQEVGYDVKPANTFATALSTLDENIYAINFYAHNVSKNDESRLGSYVLVGTETSVKYFNAPFLPNTRMISHFWLNESTRIEFKTATFGNAKLKLRVVT